MTQLMEAIGAPGVSAEGRFFPDTYIYSKRREATCWCSSGRMTALERQLEAAWALAFAPDTPLKSADESALALASVVEKETGVASDRGKVAGGVRPTGCGMGMPLQSDPTVIYGHGGELRRQPAQGGPADRHARTTRYTRTRGCLPRPSRLPGRDALRAAVRPEATKALYFVSRGDGSSVVQRYA